MHISNNLWFFKELVVFYSCVSTLYKYLSFIVMRIRTSVLEYEPYNQRRYITPLARRDFRNTKTLEIQ